MFTPMKVVLFSLLTLGTIASISCSKGSSPAARQLLSSSVSRSGDAANDYTKPYLSDDKVHKFLDSMKEEHNPFEVIFKQGGQARNPLDIASKMEEFNAFARRYGFQDYQDYTAVWGRIVVGEMQILGEQTFRDMISSAQAELKKPDLNPDMRKIYEEQVATSQKALDDMSNNKSQSALNAADLELVKKYKSQIDDAEKKYQASK